jgi:guanylate kinase
MAAMHKIFGFVGPSHAGKSTLILEMVRLFPTHLAPLRSLTTRAWREASDDQFYEFVTPQEILKRKTEGRLLQSSEYAGNLYANDKPDTDAFLASKHGALALVEWGVFNFRRAGYEVVPIRIIPEDATASADALRASVDNERQHIALDYAITVRNSFLPGGKERAFSELADFFRSSLV